MAFEWFDPTFDSQPEVGGKPKSRAVVTFCISGSGTAQIDFRGQSLSAKIAGANDLAVGTDCSIVQPTSSDHWIIDADLSYPSRWRKPLADLAKENLSGAFLLDLLKDNPKYFTYKQAQVISIAGTNSLVIRDWNGEEKTLDCELSGTLTAASAFSVGDQVLCYQKGGGSWVVVGKASDEVLEIDALFTCLNQSPSGLVGGYSAIIGGSYDDRYILLNKNLTLNKNLASVSGAISKFLADGNNLISIGVNIVEYSVNNGSSWSFYSPEKVHDIGFINSQMFGILQQYAGTAWVKKFNFPSLTTQWEYLDVDAGVSSGNASAHPGFNDDAYISSLIFLGSNVPEFIHTSGKLADSTSASGFWYKPCESKNQNSNYWMSKFRIWEAGVGVYFDTLDFGEAKFPIFLNDGTFRVIVANVLYKFSSGAWTTVTLPSPYSGYATFHAVGIDNEGATYYSCDNGVNFKTIRFPASMNI